MNGNLKENIEIEIKNLYKVYGKNKIFYEFNMRFIKGKITIILGKSGCGKTTLLNLISGIDKNYSGNIIVRSSKIAYIFQEDRLIKSSNVFGNIAFVLKSILKKKDIEPEVLRYLKIVEMEDYAEKFPDELSGGMKRRIALARAIAYNGDLLLMDEPFKGMDHELKQRIMKRLLKLHEERNNSIVMVTHDGDEAKVMGDNIYSLD